MDEFTKNWLNDVGLKRLVNNISDVDTQTSILTR